VNFRDVLAFELTHGEGELTATRLPIGSFHRQVAAFNTATI
jgi:hypothetical protein